MTKKQLYASSFVAVISIFSILGFLLFDDDNAKADSDVVTTNVQIEKSIHDTDDDIRRKIRIAYERMMISGKIPGKFFRDPYSYSMDDGRMIIPHPKDRGVSVEPIKDSDILDLMIGNVKIPSGSGSFSFDIPIIGTGASIYLFKSAKDLKELGYETISYRERLNKDEKYRRNNIAVGFENIGHVVVLNPGDRISYLEDSGLNARSKKFMDGLSIVGDGTLKNTFAGGACGGSTALFQGILSNSALSIITRSAHSIWYSSLYSATIEGKKIKTPGLDATVYIGQTDFVVKNSSDHPVVVVLDYNGKFDGKEYNFTIGFTSDIAIPPALVSEKDKCYKWNVRGKKNFTACYKSLNP